VQPRVSIGVPVYNCEAFLHLALDSLLAQTFSDFEIIISDNASTDGTEQICREYTARDSRIRYFRQSANKGASANFRFVLEQAGGDFFMWAAADDERAPDCIEYYLSVIGKAGGAFSTYAVRDRKSATDTEMIAPVLSGQANCSSDIRNFVYNPCPSFIYGLYRRSTVLALFPSAVFDWYDCFFILSVIQSAGFVCVKSAPKYFAGTFGEYVAKPSNGRYLMPLNYFLKAFPIVAEGGPSAILAHLGIFATATKLNYRIAKQALVQLKPA
jgi:glycosyltransferase involved in cell wall biosynthesis